MKKKISPEIAYKIMKAAHQNFKERLKEYQIENLINPSRENRVKIDNLMDLLELTGALSDQALDIVAKDFATQLNKVRKNNK